MFAFFVIAIGTLRRTCGICESVLLTLLLDVRLVLLFPLSLINATKQSRTINPKHPRSAGVEFFCFSGPGGAIGGMCWFGSLVIVGWAGCHGGSTVFGCLLLDPSINDTTFRTIRRSCQPFSAAFWTPCHSYPPLLSLRHCQGATGAGSCQRPLRAALASC